MSGRDASSSSRSGGSLPTWRSCPGAAPLLPAAQSGNRSARRHTRPRCTSRATMWRAAGPCPRRDMKLEAVGLKKYFPVTGGLSLSRARGWVKAVDGVSVQVVEGETLGIVGESGSGKTTLAKLFLLLERPTAGSLFFDGKAVADFGRDDFARYRHAVQAVFQDPYSSLNPRMRVEDIVAEPLPPDSSLSRAIVAERVGEVLQLVGLRRESAALYPHEFSGGQRQRIAIARALVTYPKFIIL